MVRTVVAAGDGDPGQVDVPPGCYNNCVEDDIVSSVRHHGCIATQSLIYN